MMTLDPATSRPATPPVKIKNPNGSDFANPKKLGFIEKEIVFGQSESASKRNMAMLSLPDIHTK